MGKWLLLGVPITTFALGSWQVYRKNWAGRNPPLATENLLENTDGKETIIAALDKRMSEPEIDLPMDVAVVEDMDYRRVTVVGKYEHESELLLTPRTRLREAFDGNAGEPGVHLLTPFVRSDTGERLIVNRGWVPDEFIKPSSRQSGQTQGEVTLTAIVHNPKKGKPNQFVPDNSPETSQWHWVDLPALAAYLKTKAILVEAVDEMTPEDGLPIGGQSQVNIRNEHMQYIITWYSLSAATLAMWFIRVRPDQLLKRVRP